MLLVLWFLFEWGNNCTKIYVCLLFFSFWSCTCCLVVSGTRVNSCKSPKLSIRALFQLLCSPGPIKLQFWFPCLLCFLWVFFLFEGTEKIQGKIGWIFLWTLQHQIPCVLFRVSMGASPTYAQPPWPQVMFPVLIWAGSFAHLLCGLRSNPQAPWWEEWSEEWAWEELEWHRCDPGVYTRTTNYKFILHWGLTWSNFWPFFWQ